MKVPELGFTKSLDDGEYRVEPEGMKTKVWRKGGPVLETMAIYASPGRIVRVSSQPMSARYSVTWITQQGSLLVFTELKLLPQQIFFFAVFFRVFFCYNLTYSLVRLVGLEKIQFLL